MDSLEITLNELRKAGWYVGRKIDTTEIEEHLVEMGYEIFPPVKKFLEEYGVLEVIVKTDDSDEEHHSTNTIKAIGKHRTNGRFKELEGYAGEHLVPVGTLSNRYLVMFVSEGGKFYCDTGKLGDNALEAWQAIVTETGFKAWGKF